jgi:hypothetical protein
MSNMVVVGSGAFSKDVAYKRVVRCKRMLSEMGYDPDNGLFDALTDLAALKTKVRRKTVRSAVQQAKGEIICPTCKVPRPYIAYSETENKYRCIYCNTTWAAN